MNRLFAIARSACVETLRQPIYGLLIVLTVLVLVLNLPMAAWTMGQGQADYKRTDQAMLMNLGLSTLLVAGLLLAAFSAASVLAREIEDRTILTVLAKPVPRASIVLGKFLGVSAALIVAYYLCSLVFLLTVRHEVVSAKSDPYDWPVIVLGLSALGLSLAGALVGNYVFGWNYSSAATAFGAALLTVAGVVVGFVGKGWHLVPFGAGIPGPLLSAMALMLLAVLVFAAVAVAASTRLGQLLTLLVCLGVLGIGSTSYYLLGRHEHILAARVAYAVLPNLSLFYGIDALMQERTISLAYVGTAALYALLQIVAVLAVGVALFQGREIDARPGTSSAPALVSMLAWAGRTLAIALAATALVTPSLYGPVQGLALSAALAALAAGNWIFWGLFGRGVRWSYPAVLALSAAGFVAMGLQGVLALTAGPAKPQGLLLPVAGAAGCLAIGLDLLRPKLRRHFARPAR